jgi:zinc/manganese transport system substrate-binding protein
MSGALQRQVGRAAKTVAALGAALTVLACAGTSPGASTASMSTDGGSGPAGGRPTIVVTTTILGAVVGDLVGDAAAVTVLMPRGVDPHDWDPSARDIEAVHRASLVVANGLGLEAGLDNALADAERAGVAVFRASDHITVRKQQDVNAGGGSVGAGAADDPHFWTDPVMMEGVVHALASRLREDLGLDLTTRTDDLVRRLAALDTRVRSMLEPIPVARRKLVTGHESMGYFADRYGFAIVGAVIPGLTSLGEPSPSELADLKARIAAEGVKVVFAEIGTPAAVTQAIAAEAGVRLVELPSHTLPADGSYFTYLEDIARPIADALAGP